MGLLEPHGGHRGGDGQADLIPFIATWLIRKAGPVRPAFFRHEPCIHCKAAFPTCQLFCTAASLSSLV
jgi:hypothetical protein